MFAGLTCPQHIEPQLICCTAWPVSMVPVCEFVALWSAVAHAGGMSSLTAGPLMAVTTAFRRRAPLRCDLRSVLADAQLLVPAGCQRVGSPVLPRLHHDRPAGSEKGTGASHCQQVCWAVLWIMHYLPAPPPTTLTAVHAVVGMQQSTCLETVPRW